MDEGSLRGPVVVDNFLSAGACHAILERFPPLPPDTKQIRCDIQVPEEVKRRINDFVEWCIIGDDPSDMDWEPISAAGSGLESALPGKVQALECALPGKVSLGSSRAMHRDTRFDANGQFEETTIDGYVAVLYLDGNGKLVFDSGSGETDVMLKPGRLIVWLNESCMHRVECSADGPARRLLGPMYISPEGLVQACGHQGTLMSEIRAGQQGAPPKTDVAITVSRAGKDWSCAMISGEVVTRVPLEQSGTKGCYNYEQDIKRAVADALPDKDVNVVLLDASGETFYVSFEEPILDDDEKQTSGCLCGGITG